MCCWSGNWLCTCTPSAKFNAFCPFSLVFENEDGEEDMQSLFASVDLKDFPNQVNEPTQRKLLEFLQMCGLPAPPSALTVRDTLQAIFSFKNDVGLCWMLVQRGLRKPIREVFSQCALNMYVDQASVLSQKFEPKALPSVSVQTLSSAAKELFPPDDPSVQSPSSKKEQAEEAAPRSDNDDNGEHLSATKLVLNSLKCLPVEEHVWFYDVDRPAAEQMLAQPHNGPGSFLVRPSSKEGCFALSKKVGPRHSKHMLLVCEASRWKAVLGAGQATPSFSTVSAVIEHLQAVKELGAPATDQPPGPQSEYGVVCAVAGESHS
eukprot:m.264714 g.264714  ORF g.264714 m.264714 type:complete len:319 (-) comp22776_c0_seq1:89-1045(-)